VHICVLMYLPDHNMWCIKTDKTHSEGYYNKHRAGLPLLNFINILSPQYVHCYKI